MKNITPFVSVVGIGQMGLGTAKNIQNAGYLNSIFEINESLLSKFKRSENLLV